MSTIGIRGGHGNLPLVGITAALCIIAGAFIPNWNFSTVPADLLALAIACAILSILAAGIWISAREVETSLWLNPCVMLFAFLVVAYAIRPILIIASSDFGASFGAGIAYEGGASELRLSLFLILISTLAFTTSFLLAPAVPVSRLLNAERVLRRDWVLRLAVVGAISFLATAIVADDIFGHSRGWQAALQGRSSLFEGRNFLPILMGTYKLGLFVVLAYRFSPRSGVSRMTPNTAIVLWLPTAIVDVLTGSRSELILYNLIPFLVLVSASIDGWARKRTSTLAMAVLVPVVLVTYRTIVRDQVTGNAQSSDWKAISANLLNLPRDLLDSGEFAVFDSFYLVVRDIPTVVSHRGLIETVQSVVAAPIPSLLLSGKPLRGSVALTQELVPVAARSGGNIAFSAAADLYFAAGAFATIIGWASLGFVGGMLIRGAMLNSPNHQNFNWNLLFGFTASAGLLLILRVDLTNIAFLLIKLMTLIALWRIFTEESQSLADSSERPLLSVTRPDSRAISGEVIG